MSRQTSRKAKLYYDEPFSSSMARQRKRNQQRYFEASFNCRHCAALVCANPLLSGVLNRNHCPYCLWSRHVDLTHAGDRLSACREGMRPIGLTVKQSKNKYAQQAGELMLVHQCVGCGAFSINRIAADDIADLIVAVYRESLSLSAATRMEFSAQGIELLGQADQVLVQERLFGVEVEQNRFATL